MTKQLQAERDETHKKIKQLQAERQAERDEAHKKIKQLQADLDEARRPVPPAEGTATDAPAAETENRVICLRPRSSQYKSTSTHGLGRPAPQVHSTRNRS